MRTASLQRSRDQGPAVRFAFEEEGCCFQVIYSPQRFFAFILKRKRDECRLIDRSLYFSLDKK